LLVDALRVESDFAFDHSKHVVATVDSLFLRLHRFTAAHRLHQSREFDLLYKQGRRQSDHFFSVLFRSNQFSHARLGLSVSVKAIGNAVNRNRVKRAVRESFRLHQHVLPPLDLVVNARPAARQATGMALSRSLQTLWTAIATQCAQY
jgi:ribonuclease P protein component